MAINMKQNDAGSLIFVDDRPLSTGGTSVASFDPTNRVLGAIVGSVARTDTASKTIGILPKGCIPVEGYTWVELGSNANTATISVGYTGASTAFVSARSVTATTATQTAITSGMFSAPSTTADVNVTAIYAEGSTASNAGGPFDVVIKYYRP
jgi:hypothetical protein